MTSLDPVTSYLRQCQEGDPDGAQKLWELYFRRLVGLARQRLAGRPRRAADEEDVALSAFASFCRGAEGGRFPRLDDRRDLWRLLVTITARKALDLIDRDNALKHGGGKLRQDFGEVPGPEPTPEFAAQVAEEYRRLLDRLDSPELRNVAVWKMEGYSNEEIAAKLGCVARTVERKLRAIRVLWGQEDEQ
jgi:DNA-directed RNA polymerase specialized sigma24 family protein